MVPGRAGERAIMARPWAALELLLAGGYVCTVADSRDRGRGFAWTARSLREGLSDRPWVTAGKAEFDSEPVALCEQTVYCGRVVALGAYHLGQVGDQVLGADLADASYKVECLLDMCAGRPHVAAAVRDFTQAFEGCAMLCRSPPNMRGQLSSPAMPSPKP